jgi:divalent metal cation (Fe/Co/Zn/Cd) transporter
MAALVDSTLDLIGGLIVYAAAAAANKPDPRLFPAGRKRCVLCLHACAHRAVGLHYCWDRMEPLAVIILAVTMSIASVEIIVESARKLNEGDKYKYKYKIYL